MALDLTKTTEAARKIYYEVLDDIGTPCIVDNIENTKVLYKNDDSPNNELMDSLKLTSFKITVTIEQGSLISFFVTNIATQVVEQLKGLCFSKPSQDPVSSTALVLIFNSIVKRERITNTYNIDRTIKETIVNNLENIDVFIQRKNYSEKLQDIGTQGDLVFKMICGISNDLKKNDVIVYDNKKYIIKDIEDTNKTNFITCYITTKKG